MTEQSKVSLSSSGRDHVSAAGASDGQSKAGFWRGVGVLVALAPLSMAGTGGEGLLGKALAGATITASLALASFSANAVALEATALRARGALQRWRAYRSVESWLREICKDGAPGGLRLRCFSALDLVNQVFDAFTAPVAQQPSGAVLKHSGPVGHIGGMVGNVVDSSLLQGNAVRLRSATGRAPSFAM